MKKILLLAMMAFGIFSCKTTSATSTKLDNKSEVGMKGNWTIVSVEYPSKDNIKVNSFGLADSQCFVGTTWKFISNNNKGEMTMDKGNCPQFSSPITWFVNKEGQFVLKVLNAGEKAKRVRDGYVLSVENQTPTSFELVDKVDVLGKMTRVVYQFSKI
jgi:hypothetical protein